MITLKQLNVAFNEQLHQILEELRGVNDECMSSAMNPEDIENRNKIYFE